MNASFYTAARGAMTQQDRMNVISNNLANVNTIGFKAKNAVFSDLMHCVMHGQENVTHGTGVKLERTTTDFTSGGMTAAAEGGYNYYIDGDGFFMLKDQITGEISYTRAGNFSLSKVAAAAAELYTPEIPEERQTCTISSPCSRKGVKYSTNSSTFTCEVRVGSPASMRA